MGSWIDETAYFERRDREIRHLKLMGVNVDGGLLFDAEYAAARASLPTVQGTPIACPGASIPCPDFEEVTTEVSPFLEIAVRADETCRADETYWVRCLTCGTWVMPAEGGTPAEVLEYAGETHACGILR
jgi:hypothetical protein